MGNIFNSSGANDNDGVKIVFLDVDGVLNSQKTVFTMQLYVLEDDKLERLQKLINTTNAKIVISSTWRYSPNAKNRLLDALKQRKIFKNYIGDTPNFSGDRSLKRTDEIETFLVGFEQKISQWIAIDDMKLHEMNPKLMQGHFVHTSIEDGFTDEHLKQAIQLLQTKQSETKNDQK